MGCKTIPGFGVVCSRGSRGSRSPCGELGVAGVVCMRQHEFLCDYPLTGAKAGQTCSRKLCREHRRHQADGRDFCPAHDRAASKEAR